MLLYARETNRELTCKRIRVRTLVRERERVCVCVPAMEKRNIVKVIMLFCVRLRVKGRQRETGIRRNVSYKEKRRILLLMQIRLTQHGTCNIGHSSGLYLFIIAFLPSARFEATTIQSMDVR